MSGTRPIATEQSFLRYPLNQLVGTPAHVRLLRILADEVVGPISASEAADRTGLTETGARRALGHLAKTGFVVRMGGGRSQHFALREDEPLTQSLTTLFRTERRAAHREKDRDFVRTLLVEELIDPATLTQRIADLGLPAADTTRLVAWVDRTVRDLERS